MEKSVHACCKICENLCLRWSKLAWCLVAHLIHWAPVNEHGYFEVLKKGDFKVANYGSVKPVNRVTITSFLALLNNYFFFLITMAGYSPKVLIKVLCFSSSSVSLASIFWPPSRS